MSNLNKRARNSKVQRLTKLLNQGNIKTMQNKNKRRQTPIPFLAYHIARFNARKETKQELAQARAILADRIFALSQPTRKQRL